MTESCASCRFSLGGICRRYPPQYTLTEAHGHSTLFPSVGGEDWCGEYQASTAVADSEWQWPEWIKPGAWIAMDRAGEWRIHDEKPESDNCTGWCRYISQTLWFGVQITNSEMFDLDFTPPPCTNWKQSLRQKPV